MDYTLALVKSFDMQTINVKIHTLKIHSFLIPIITEMKRELNISSSSEY